MKAKLVINILSSLKESMRNLRMKKESHDIEDMIKLIVEDSPGLMSHYAQPNIGDYVENVNPGCKHFGSKGKVSKIDLLPEDKGATIEYIVDNEGDTYSPGSVLSKTLDQLKILDGKNE